MAQANLRFEKRLKRISNRHQRMTRGAVTEMRPDGLMVIRPKRRIGTFFWKPVAGLIIGVFLFKAFLLAGLGPITYEARLEQLRGGTMFEVQAAWVLQSDPVTSFLADQIAPFLPNLN